MHPIAWSVTNHRVTVSTNMPLSLKGSKPLVITCVLVLLSSKCYTEVANSVATKLAVT